MNIPARVRASVELVSVEPADNGWWQVIQRFTVEVEGSAKPACVAEMITLIVPA